MSSFERKLRRKIKRDNKELPMKKVLARKMGLSLDELNRKYFREDKKNG